MRRAERSERSPIRVLPGLTKARSHGAAPGSPADAPTTSSAPSTLWPLAPSRHRACFRRQRIIFRACHIAARNRPWSKFCERWMRQHQLPRPNPSAPILFPAGPFWPSAGESALVHPPCGHSRSFLMTRRIIRQSIIVNYAVGNRMQMPVFIGPVLPLKPIKPVGFFS